LADQNKYYYEYHIVYSPTYQVPVLYFNGQLEGRFLNAEEIWANIPTKYREDKIHFNQNYIQQVEHPVLCVPYFMIHPCNTSKLMENVEKITLKNQNYILQWLNLLAPVIGLYLSKEWWL